MTMEDSGSVEGWLDKLLDLRVAAVLLLALTVLTRFALKGIGRYKEIPEPPAWPLIGHLHLFRALPHQMLMKLSRRYGPLMSVRLGSLRVLVASSSEMAREFLKTQDAIWASRPPTPFGEFFFYNYNDMITQPLNDKWRRMRKIYNSQFLSTTNVEKQKDQRHESIMHMVNSLLESQRGNDEPVDMYTVVCTMNFYQMTKLVFGKAFSLDQTSRTSTGEQKTLTQLVREFTSSPLLSLGECFPWLKWMDLDGVKKKFKKIHAEFDNFLSELLEERRLELVDGQNNEDATDLSRALLSLLDKDDGTGLTYDNIKGAIADMFVAGTETTAGLVAFTIAEIMRHPDVKQKLVKELDDVAGRDRLVEESDLVNLNYLKMVIKESLRLHPALPLMVNHSSTSSTVIAGYHIPAGSQVLINVYAIQRDPKSWEEPLAFKPERFLDSKIDLKGQHFELLPFGAGRRQCPGMNMGLITLEFVLARLFQTVEMSLPPGMKPEEVDMTEVAGSATGLATPLRVVVSPRLSPELYSK